MSRMHWRWSEQDFGFRFRSGGGGLKKGLIDHADILTRTPAPVMARAVLTKAS